MHRKKITIDAEISVPDFVKAAVQWIIEKTKGDRDNWASGDYAQIGASGDYAQIGASGDYAQIESAGDRGVIASAGVDTLAKGAIGTWISLAEFVDGNCVGFAVGCIGEDGLKPETWYSAKNGKLVEVWK